MAIEYSGAPVAVTLWVASTVLLRFDQNHSGAKRTYGGLNALVALLLWLYFTGAAIFISGEANSEIEKAAGKARGAQEGPGKGGEGNPTN